jgi:hypothetical protein
MPNWLTVRVKRPHRRAIRIWVPVLPVVLVLSPVLLIAIAVAAVTCIVYRINVVRAFVGGWRLFAALRGTRVDIEHGRTAVLVNVG